MGLLSGLESLGLGNLADKEVMAKEEEKKAAAASANGTPAIPPETELILDKSFVCPVCDSKFVAKMMKSGKAKLKGTDFDLRPRFEGIEAAKYDVILCPRCGYAALQKFFPTVLPAQRKLIIDNISVNVRLTVYDDEIYTFDEAMERYQLALANTVVKKAKMSERAYVCLKSAWVLRGYQEELAAEDEKAGTSKNEEKISALKTKEQEYLQTAYEGFIEARQNESFPICGMNEITIDFLLSNLAFHLKDYDTAMRLVGGLLTASNASPQIKDKARDLKDRINAAKKAGN